MKSRPGPCCRSVDGIFIDGRLVIEGLVFYSYVSRILKSCLVFRPLGFHHPGPRWSSLEQITIQEPVWVKKMAYLTLCLQPPAKMFGFVVL